MGTINVDTGKLKSGKAKLEEFRVYFNGKAGTFSSGSFGSGGNLDNYLSKVQENYRQIASNIEKVKEYISEYAEDVENLENEMCGEAGSIHDATVSGSISRGKVDIKESKIREDKLFSGYGLGDLGETTQIADDKYDYRKIYNSLIGKRDYQETGSRLAKGLIWGLAGLEGVANVGESFYDGLCWVASVSCSAIGADEVAERLGEEIKKDYTKEWYYQAVEKSGLDRYADPNSTGARISSGIGNVIGNVVVNVFTGGLVASAFGVGTKTAMAANSIISAGRQALMDAGIGTEMALQRGASLKQAQLAGGIDAAVGAVTGAISGRLDQAARGVGATGDKGKILNYALTSFGVGASEPLINEATHTAIYYNDKDKYSNTSVSRFEYEEYSFLKQYIKNSKNDGLLTQMLLAGGTRALGTLGNGISAIKKSSKYSLKDKVKSKISDINKKWNKTAVPSHEYLSDINHQRTVFGLKDIEEVPASSLKDKVKAKISDINKKWDEIAVPSDEYLSSNFTQEQFNNFRVRRLTDYTNKYIVDELYSKYNKYVSRDIIKQEASRVYFHSPEERDLLVKKGCIKKTIGGVHYNKDKYVDGFGTLKVGSHLFLNYDDDYIKTAIPHEMLHGLGSVKYYDGDLKKFACGGFNETLTEYFNLKSGTKYYSDGIQCDYTDSICRFKKLQEIIKKIDDIVVEKKLSDSNTKTIGPINQYTNDAVMASYFGEGKTQLKNIYEKAVKEICDMNGIDDVPDVISWNKLMDAFDDRNLKGIKSGIHDIDYILRRLEELTDVNENNALKYINEPTIKPVSNDSQSGDGPIIDHGPSISQSSDGPTIDHGPSIPQSGDGPTIDHGPSIPQSGDGPTIDHGPGIPQSGDGPTIDHGPSIPQSGDGLEIKKSGFKVKPRVHQNNTIS